MNSKKPGKSSSLKMESRSFGKYSHHTARRFFGSLPLWSLLLNLAHTDFKDFADVEVIAGGGFDKCTSELFRRPLTVLCRDLPLFDVVFGAHDDAGNGVFADKVSDLVMDDFDHLEGFAGSDRVDEDVAMDSYRIFGIQYGEFILACGVDDIAIIFLAFCLDRFCKRVLDGRMIVFDKVVLGVLDDEGRFSD